MNIQERKRLLNHLAQINSPGFVGDCIREFVNNAQVKTDDDIIACIETIKDQIQDNREAMKRILADQYHFFNRYKITQPV